ncbi:hypothetical protein QBC34DRAFT_429557 [Podospora aff. communis PSN243]|uniref:Uncharacterized protein n=1 Tax=Podospora aff. communis PSN243 TaxID=3040156 RepID=A0AAV9G9L7_9PEZI|nr:hypothetical protein QBC34DRAFT_429557 [Podospora aff. communis PSN243]
MAQPTKFPSVLELVGGMKWDKDPETTQRWDMVVSYALDPINKILTKLWKNDPLLMCPMQLMTDEEVRWELKLRAPSLRFTIDQRGELAMPLNGTWQKQGTQPDGTLFPVCQIPDEYVLVAKVPIDYIKADSTNAKARRRIRGDDSTYISFDGDPSQQIHIVFNFETLEGGAGAQYEIRYLGNNPAENGRLPHSLSEALAAWMADHVDAIRYSLATFTNVDVPDTTYLVPQSVAFSVYSGPKDSNIGCLSVYIKTKGSGNEPGLVDRSFKLPKTNTNSFPIPEGYTASIIIRHKLFAERFLIDSLMKQTTDGSPIFKNVSDASSDQVPGFENFGFKLDCQLNAYAKYPGKHDRQQWSSSDIDAINFDFSKTPLVLEILEWNGRHGENPKFATSADWKYDKFEGTVKWREESRMCGTSPRVQEGRETYTLGLAKMQPTFQVVDNKVMEIVLGLQSSDWQASYSTGDPDITKAFQSIKLPSFSFKLDLNFFASANIFAPNQQMVRISPDPRNSVKMPYDVLLMGHVVDDISPVLRPRQTGPPKLCHRHDIHRVDAPIGNTADFVNALANFEPVYAKALAAISTGSEDEMDNFFKTCDYDITAEGLEDALKTVAPGPHFDLRNAPGIYKFDQPGLAQAEMVVAASTGRIYIDNQYVPNTVDPAGNIVFNYDSYTYSLVFYVTSTDDDIPNPTAFSGTRRPSDLADNPPSFEEAISGTQRRGISTSASDWLSKPGTLLALFCIDMLAIFGPPLYSIFRRWLRGKREKWAKAAADASRGIENVTQNALKIGPSILDHVFENLAPHEITAMSTVMENAVRRLVNVQDLERVTNVDDALIHEAAEAAREAYEAHCRAQLMASLSTGMHELVTGLNPIAKGVILRQIMDEGLQARAEKFNKNATYVLALVQKYTVDRAVTAATEVRNAHEVVMDEASVALAEQREARQELEEEIRQGHIQEDQAELDHMDQEIAHLEEQLDHAQADFLADMDRIADLQRIAQRDRPDAEERARRTIDDFIKKPIK